MKFRVLPIIFLILINACGIIDDKSEQTTYLYKYILKNHTGESLFIIGDFGPRNELIPSGESFTCEYKGSINDVGGFCSGLLEIRIFETNSGYRCYGTSAQVEGLCFVNDERVFTRLEGTIFTEIDTRVYEYVLTPELLKGAFELPD